jgi:hypothetical protein
VINHTALLADHEGKNLTEKGAHTNAIILPFNGYN